MYFIVKMFDCSKSGLDWESLNLLQISFKISFCSLYIPDVCGDCPQTVQQY
jgi:hypothetical protein